jgi:transcriptional regulator with XRE-family HTH domain
MRYPIGMTLSHIRARLGYSQKQLAEAVGVDQATISRIEAAQSRGGELPKVTRTVTLAALAVYHRLDA